MVPVINELEKRGLAERKLPPADGRARQIFLTEEGARLLSDLKERFARHQGGLIRKVGKSDAEKLLKILLKIADLG